MSDQSAEIAELNERIDKLQRNLAQLYDVFCETAMAHELLMDTVSAAEVGAAIEQAKAADCPPVNCN